MVTHVNMGTHGGKDRDTIRAGHQMSPPPYPHVPLALLSPPTTYLCPPLWLHHVPNAHPQVSLPHPHYLFPVPTSSPCLYPHIPNSHTAMSPPSPRPHVPTSMSAWSPCPHPVSPSPCPLLSPCPHHQMPTTSPCPHHVPNTQRHVPTVTPSLYPRPHVPSTHPNVPAHR